jgi:hypothetical protein
VSCRYEVSSGWRKSARAAKLRALSNGLASISKVTRRSGCAPATGQGDCVMSSHSQ